MKQLDKLHEDLKKWDGKATLYPLEKKYDHDTSGGAKEANKLRWDCVCDRAEQLVRRSEDLQSGDLQPVNPTTGETLLMLAVLAVGPNVDEHPLTSHGHSDSSISATPAVQSSDSSQNIDARKELKDTLMHLMENCPVGQVTVPAYRDSGRRGQMLDAKSTDGSKTALTCVIEAAANYNLQNQAAIHAGVLFRTHHQVQALSLPSAFPRAQHPTQAF